MARDPAERPESAGELVAELCQAFEDGRPDEPDAGAEPSRWHRRCRRAPASPRRRHPGATRTARRPVVAAHGRRAPAPTHAPARPRRWPRDGPTAAGCCPWPGWSSRCSPSRLILALAGGDDSSPAAARRQAARTVRRRAAAQSDGGSGEAGRGGADGGADGPGAGSAGGDSGGRSGAGDEPAQAVERLLHARRRGRLRGRVGAGRPGRARAARRLRRASSARSRRSRRSSSRSSTTSRVGRPRDRRSSESVATHTDRIDRCRGTVELTGGERQLEDRAAERRPATRSPRGGQSRRGDTPGKGPDAGRRKKPKKASRTRRRLRAVRIAPRWT